jgi:hypothetical protein
LKRIGGRIGYTDLNTVQYSKYLYEMFRHTAELLCDYAAFEELALAMNRHISVAFCGIEGNIIRP